MFAEIVAQYDQEKKKIDKEKSLAFSRVKAMNLRLSNDILERINDVVTLNLTRASFQKNLPADNPLARKIHTLWSKRNHQRTERAQRRSKNSHRFFERMG